MQLCVADKLCGLSWKHACRQHPRRVGVSVAGIEEPEHVIQQSCGMHPKWFRLAKLAIRMQAMVLHVIINVCCRGTCQHGMQATQSSVCSPLQITAYQVMHTRVPLQRQHGSCKP